MLRLIFWFAVLVAVTFGATWLADSPGEFSMVVRGYRIETQSVGLVVLALGLLFVSIWIAWGLLKWVLGRPSAFGGFFSRRRERKGRQALSTGLVAIGAGDDDAARKAAVVATRMLPDDPLAQLLAAQSAQQQGDSAKVKQVYKEMTAAPDTKLLGLRGLFNQARREKNIDAARSIAKQALEENPGVSWASNAMLVSYAADKDWPAVLLLLENQQKAKIIDKQTATSKKAVVLTAQAQNAEDSEPSAAMELATSAHKLDPALVPAAVVAARTNIAIGSLRKASRILEQTWKQTPHPDIAEVYAHARPGDSASDRLARIKALLRIAHGGPEGAIALAVAAIEAQDWKEARQALNPQIHDQPSVRICTLMAEIEARELGDKGRAREWLARAVNARRDPTWTAGSFVSEEWLPVSPQSGELGVFEWKVPVKGHGYSESITSDATPPFLLNKEPPEAETAEIKEVEVVTIDAETQDKATDSKPDDKAEETQKPVEKKPQQPTKQPAEKTKAKDDKPARPTPASAPANDAKDKSKSPTHRLPDDPGPKKPDDDKSGESWFG
jgi:HemY protein